MSSNSPGRDRSGSQQIETEVLPCGNFVPDPSCLADDPRYRFCKTCSWSEAMHTQPGDRK